MPHDLLKSVETVSFERALDYEDPISEFPNPWGARMTKIDDR
jgi:hypothetical protein